jgi:hypothetical protein
MLKNIYTAGAFLSWGASALNNSTVRVSQAYAEWVMSVADTLGSVVVLLTQALAASISPGVTLMCPPNSNLDIIVSWFMLIN